MNVQCTKPLFYQYAYTVVCRGLIAVLLLITPFISVSVLADGVVVDKVYHPYVLPNEHEFEWRLLSRQQRVKEKEDEEDDDNEGSSESIREGNKSAQSFAYGFSISENVMLEAYVIGERDDDDGKFALSAYEVAVRWMLTEQGEYWADWGMLFEIEKSHKSDDWELTSGLLVEKEFGRTSLTINAFLTYEWGETLPNELEAELRVKYRYRWLPQLQPSLEFYTGQDYVGIGPGFMGIQRFEGQKQLKWEAAFIAGVGSTSEDLIFRVAIEYEF